MVLRQTWSRSFLLLWCFLLLPVNMNWSPAQVAADGPTLILDPSQARCTVFQPHMRIRGTAFPAREDLELYNYDMGNQTRPPIGVRVAVVTVGADGTFVADTQLLNCYPDTSDGTRFTIAAFRPGGAHQGLTAALATATFTVGPPATPGLPNTGGGGMDHLRTAPAGWLALDSLLGFLTSLGVAGWLYCCRQGGRSSARLG